MILCDFRESVKIILSSPLESEPIGFITDNSLI